MHIDFGALGLVALVTVLASVALVTLVSIGARLLDTGTPGGAQTSRRSVGWISLALAGALILYGLYLVIPFFHH